MVFKRTRYIGAGLLLLALIFSGCMRVPQNEKLGIDSTVQAPLEIILDGQQLKLPQEMDIPHGKVLDLEIVSPQTLSQNELIEEPDSRYTFISWNDGSKEQKRSLTVLNALELKANVKSEFLFKVTTEPKGLVEVSGAGWHEKNSQVTLEAPEVDGYVFHHWMINKKITETENPLVLVADNPKRISAVYVKQGTLVAPGNLRVTGYNTDSITLSWNDGSTDEEGFELYRKIATGSYAKIATLGVDETTYTDSEVNSGSTYYYKVRAFAGTTYSNYSNEVIQSLNSVPLVPSNPNPANGATDIQRDLVLSWSGSDPDSDPLTYDFYFGTSNNPPLEFSNLSVASKTVTGLQADTMYYWKVVAKDNHGGVKAGPVWSFRTTGDPVVTGPYGAFKVANSWGTGGWEKVADGFYYFTYEAMKAAKVRAYIAAPKEGYSPRAIAVFEIDHSNRGSTDIYVGVGSTSAPSKLKKFDNVYYNGGNHAYPDNAMVMDITELLPLQGENVFLKFYDSSSDSATGRIESFSIEIFDDYSSGTPSKTFAASDTPVYSKNGSSVYSVIGNVTVTDSWEQDFSGLSNFETRSITDNDLMEMKEEIGTYEDGVDYNEIIMGFGTGLKPPTEEMWSDLKSNGRIIEGLSGYTTQDMASRVDWSESIYFPGIGNQGGEGSCVAFNFAYYVSSFYNARENDWDLSGNAWTGGYYGAPSAAYQDKTFSPDFIYHQINGGVDGGSWYGDAIEIISNLGIASWEKMPYSTRDHTSWPSEAAWREAPQYRSAKESLWTITVDDDNDINTLKSLLNAGYLVVISIDAGKYSGLTSDDFWTTSNYVNPSTNHANTIVGYDDSLKPVK